MFGWWQVIKANNNKRVDFLVKLQLDCSEMYITKSTCKSWIPLKEDKEFQH